MKQIILLFGILILIVAGIAFVQKYPVDSLNFFKPASATINNNTFNLTVAKTQKEKEVGLSEKKSLLQNDGMLFIFDKPDYYSFWMKNMKFPIDIVFIKDSKVVTIHPNLQPPTSSDDNSLTIYKPEEPADKVLEINAGLSEKNNLKKGDEIKFQGI